MKVTLYCWRNIISGTKGHTAPAFEDNISDWTLFADGIKYESVWVTGTTRPGSIVKYNGIVIVLKNTQQEVH